MHALHSKARENRRRKCDPRWEDCPRDWQPWTGWIGSAPMQISGCSLDGARSRRCDGLLWVFGCSVLTLRFLRTAMDSARSWRCDWEVPNAVDCVEQWKRWTDLTAMDGARSWWCHWKVLSVVNCVKQRKRWTFLHVIWMKDRHECCFFHSRPIKDIITTGLLN